MSPMKSLRDEVFALRRLGDNAEGILSGGSIICGGVILDGDDAAVMGFIEGI